MNKVIVTIDGVEYPMVSEKSERHMISVAKYVDDELKPIKDANSKLSTTKIAILTALNIMDKLIEGSNENDRLIKLNNELKTKVESSNGELKSEIKNLKVDLDKQSKEIENLLNQIDTLNGEIKTKDVDIKTLNEKLQSYEEEKESFKSQIDNLKLELESANKRAKEAEEVSIEFQNRAYKVQLEKTELEMSIR